MNTLKETIKDLASKQYGLKQQRKTINFQGERTLQPWEAATKHLSNRDTLRHMYMAYGLIKGREQSEIELAPLTEINMQVVNKLIEQYKPKEECQND